jgi:protein kinase A
MSLIILTLNRTNVGVPEWAAKFYAANILEGLSYMHHRSIVYRDLKPANVMLDSAGYTVIVDFGFAKIITDNKTYTFCGTPLYLAPEIILQKGHNAGADHWVSFQPRDINILLALPCYL